MSSCVRVIFMSREKMIQRGSVWMAAQRSVPFLGVTASSSLSSVTTKIGPSLPPAAFFPNPIAQSASPCRFCSQLLSHLQQSSIGFPVWQSVNPRRRGTSLRPALQPQQITSTFLLNLHVWKDFSHCKMDLLSVRRLIM